MSTVTHASHPTLRAKTKIVATVGPASQGEEQLRALIEAGTDVFRINMAHGNTAEKEAIFQRIRDVSRQLDRVVAVLVDLGGPKIRLTELPNGLCDVKEGDKFRFVRGNECSLPNLLAVTYDKLVDELDVGDRVLLADGTVGMVVDSKDADGVDAHVVQAGIFRSRQGVNLPGVKLSVHALSDLDREHAIWAAKLGVDFLGMSFVRTADEVRELKFLLNAQKTPGPKPKVIAKIEKGEALENLDELIQAADGVMVARGDLGVEIDVAQLAVVQKKIIATCNFYQKPVIVATQMLDSMTHNTSPTRAEATDVANAILDGTDACMLSGETAVGLHPAIVVKMMNRIALATEPILQKAIMRIGGGGEKRAEGLEEITEAVVKNAARIAEQLSSRLIVVASHSGLTALAMAKQRSSVPVVGVSDSQTALRQMCLYWGVTPLSGIPTSDSGELLQAIGHWGRSQGCLTDGQRVVLVASTHWTSRGHNMVVVHQVGD